MKDYLKFYNTLIFLIIFSCFPSTVLSQSRSLDSPQLMDSGEAYLKALRFKRINHDITYFDPSAPMPALEINALPEPKQRDSNKKNWAGISETWTVTRTMFLVVTVVLLTLIISLFVKFGGKITLSSRGEIDNAYSRRRRSNSGDVSLYDDILPLKDIVKLADRREAIIQLSRFALNAAAKLDSVLLQPSWTGRDALRHLVKGQTYASALSSVVFASEEVQFGGRDISEQEFDTLKAGIDPLLKQAEA